MDIVEVLAEVIVISDDVIEKPSLPQVFFEEVFELYSWPVVQLNDFRRKVARRFVSKVGIALGSGQYRER